MSVCGKVKSGKVKVKVGTVGKHKEQTMQLKSIDGSLAAQLKAEALGMAKAYQEALFSLLPSGAVEGIYLKGSAIRSWESEIDYVPEVSDVDMHVRLSKSISTDSIGFKGALAIGREAMQRFLAAFPAPVHKPRPQLMFLNDLEQMDGYLPSPEGHVQVLMGAPYKAAGREAYAASRSADVERYHADAEYVLHKLTGMVIDRPSQFLWTVVSRVNWRVGPAGPRLLTQLGMDPFDAWSLNRTGIYRALQQQGLTTVARAYAGYYQAGWKGFETGFSDGTHAEEALVAAHTVFAHGAEALKER